jgi:N-acetylglucosamine kinase-like BadF-type ATPase
VIQTLGFKAPIEIVNDAILGLLAGSTEGWGLALVSGTGCNCRGWDRERKNEGRVTGGGGDMGEGAGASELVAGAQKALAHEYTGRGPATELTPALVQYAGARDLPDLLEGLMQGKYHLDAAAAPVIFKVALKGDAKARELIEWAGSELGELAKAVIRQLSFQTLSFDVVLVGSMFDGGEILIDPLRRSVQSFAPGARLIQLTAPPVVGAVLLGMEQAGKVLPVSLRQKFLTAAAKLKSR